jgi:hypothetical protein
LRKNREDCIREYLDSAKKLGLPIELPTQSITKTAEAAWAVDSYAVESGDEPAAKSPHRRTR